MVDSRLVSDLKFVGVQLLQLQLIHKLFLDPHDHQLHLGLHVSLPVGLQHIFVRQGLGQVRARLLGSGKLLAADGGLLLFGVDNTH